MLLYNLNKLNFENNDNPFYIEFDINFDSFLTCNFVDFNCRLKKIIESNIKDYQENTVFKINFKTKEELDENDEQQIYDWIRNIIFDLINTKEKRDREKRLSAKIDNINSTYASWLELINNKTKINCFNIIVKFSDTIISLV